MGLLDLMYNALRILHGSIRERADDLYQVVGVVHTTFSQVHESVHPHGHAPACALHQLTHVHRSIVRGDTPAVGSQRLEPFAHKDFAGHTSVPYDGPSTWGTIECPIQEPWSPRRKP